MKNTRITVLTFALFVGFSLCQQAVGKEKEPYYRKKITDLYGPVKQVKTISYKRVDSTVMLTEPYVDRYEIEAYDRDGYLKASTSYNMKTFVVSKQTYDQNKKQGIYVTTNYTEAGTLADKITYKEDKTGRLTEVWVTKGDDTYLAQKCEYDKHGNLIQRFEYKKDGSLSLTFINEYDGKNRQIASSTYRGKDELLSKFTWRYDKKGQKLESVTYTYLKNTTRQSITTFRYFEKGRVVERRDSSTSGISLRTDVKDKKGNLLEMKWDDQGKITRRLFDRNKRGDMVTIHHFNGDRQTGLTQYTFDKQGNWIEKAIYTLFDKQKEVTRREIEYYH